jgi:hypothetical protein
MCSHLPHIAPVFCFALPCSCRLLFTSSDLAPRSFIAFLHSGPSRFLSSVQKLQGRLSASVTSLPLPTPYRQCPLGGVGTARRVNHPRAAANFSRDPPSPWGHFFCCRPRHTSRCQSSYWPSSVPIVSTAASTSSEFASKPVTFVSSRLVLISASVFSRQWRSSRPNSPR